MQPISPHVPERSRRNRTRSYNRTQPESTSRCRALEPSNGNVGDFATFIARLFERPSRHQYYRTLNQNTATLIRRLSRSNLFNNRSSQHFYGGESNNSPELTNNASQETEPFAISRQSRLTPTAPRSETPPPSYGDVISR